MVTRWISATFTGPLPGRQACDKGRYHTQKHLHTRAEGFGVLVLKTPGKAGCLAAVKTAQEGSEPKPAALRSELLRSVFPIFWGQKNELSIDR